jgi:hypothetical protein
MSDTGRFRRGDRINMVRRLEAEYESRHGGGKGEVEFDELGNAVWAPKGNIGTKEAVQRLLNDDTLALRPDESIRSLDRVQENPGGLKKGYDPYDSGMLTKKQWKKPKDLRALSKWIEQKKKLDHER